MNEDRIQFLINIDEGTSVVKIDDNKQRCFEDISKDTENGFLIDNDEINVNKRYIDYINKFFSDYDFIETTFSVYLVVNGEVSDEPLNDIISDYIYIETIQEWINDKGYLDVINEFN